MALGNSDDAAVLPTPDNVELWFQYKNAVTATRLVSHTPLDLHLTAGRQWLIFLSYCSVYPSCMLTRLGATPCNSRIYVLQLRRRTRHAWFLPRSGRRRQ